MTNIGRRILLFITAVVGVVSIGGFINASFEEDIRSWTVVVRIYSNRPQQRVEALEKMAVLTANETAKGFLNRSHIFRDDYHFGATFCLLIDGRVYEAEGQKKRILEEINQIIRIDDSLTVEVINPADCGD